MDIGIKWPSLGAQLRPEQHIQKSCSFLVAPDIFERNEGMRIGQYNELRSLKGESGGRKDAV